MPRSARRAADQPSATGRSASRLTLSPTACTFCMFSGALVNDAQWCVASESSPMEPLEILSVAPDLPQAVARQLVDFSVTAYRAQVDHVLVMRSATERGGLLAAYLRRDERLIALALYVRPHGAFSEDDEDNLRRAFPILNGALEVHLASHAGIAENRAMPALCVLSPDLEIESWSMLARPLVRIDAHGRATLVPGLRERIADAVSNWSGDVEEIVPEIVLAEDRGALLRVFPLATQNGPRVGVLWEAVRRESALLRAIELYALTRREIEILNLLAHGHSTGEISKNLAIAESTVNDHVERMMAKTGSANRAQLIATTLVS